MSATCTKWILAIVVAAVATAPSAWAGPADDQYAVAAGHYNQRRWHLAIDEFDVFLEQHDDDAKADRALFYSAESLVQLRRFDEAAGRFRRFLARNSDARLAPKALFRAGESAYLAGHLDDARRELTEFVRQAPDDTLRAYAIAYLGDVALRRREAAEARQHFNDGLERFANGPLEDDYRFGLARALEQLGEQEQARRLYAALAAKTQGALADDAQFYLGASHYAAGEYQAALEAFDAFETSFPTSKWRGQAGLAGGQALFFLARYDEAAERFEALQGATATLEARYWLGLVQKARQQWAAAAATLLAAAAELDQQADQPGEIAPPVDLKTVEQKPVEQKEGPTGEGVGRGDPAKPLSGARHWLGPALRFHAGECLLKEGRHDKAARQFELVLARWPESDLADDGALGNIRAAAAAGKHDAVERLVDDFRRQHETSPLRPAADHVLATSLIALGKFGDAVAPLESYLAAEGKSEDAWAQGQLAVCHAQTGQLDRAKELFRTLARNQAEHEAIRPTTRALAEAALRAGDPDWAAELFGTLTDDSQASGLTAKGLSGLAWSQVKAGKLELAAATFDRLLEQAPAGELAAEAALARGQILQRLGQAEQALPMYQRVIAEHPQSVQLRQALLGAARLHDQLQQDAEAGALYARLEAEFSDHPRHDGVVYEWAWVQRDLGRHGEADALFERLRGQAPRGRYWADAVYRLAERALDSNELDRALELAEELLASGAGAEIRPHALWLTAQVAIVREQWAQAAQPLERLVAEFAEHPLRLLADYYLAESAYRQDDLAVADERFARLAEQAEGGREKWLAMVPLRRAQILAHQKRWREALESAQAIAAEFPGFEQQYEADYVIGRALASLAEFDRAREAYQRVTRSPTGGKTETAAMAQWMIGESYFHQRNYQAALREYLRVEILYDYPTWQAGALLQAGKCHELLGDWQQAEKLYERIVKLYTETDFTDEAGRRLQAAQARRMPPEPRQAKGLVP